ncbi:MAG TPA: hypothetical protein VMI72_06100 [Roseiarcus sp.]|nr:hypothetical protein [Roseiarcus sp.]
MLARIVVSIIGSCVAHARLAVAPIGVVRALYAASRFRLNSDIIALPPANVERPREKLAFEKAFQRYGLLDVVVKAPTPEVAGAATGELRRSLPRTRRVFESVVDAADVRRFCYKVKDPNDTNAFLECLQFNRKRLSAACPRVGKPRRVSLQELPKRALTRAILGPLWTHWRESGSLLQGQSKGATTKAPLRATLPMLALVASPAGATPNQSARGA